MVFKTLMEELFFILKQGLSNIQFITHDKVKLIQISVTKLQKELHFNPSLLKASYTTQPTLS